MTSGEILINSLDHNFKFGFRTSSRNVINNPHGCGRFATSRSSKTLQNENSNQIKNSIVKNHTEQFVLVKLLNLLQQINIKVYN